MSESDSDKYHTLIIKDVFLGNTERESLSWFTVRPIQKGEVMGRNKFDDNGNVIGYETWVHGEDDE